MRIAVIDSANLANFLLTEKSSVPYIFWLGFAFVLNLNILLLN